MAEARYAGVCHFVAPGQVERVEPFEMSQPAVSKHLKVLEASGLIERGQVGQSRPAYLKAAPMKEAVGWMEQFSRFWSGSFDQLDTLLETMKSSEKDNRTDD